jgi:hypothetical protein
MRRTLSLAVAGASALALGACGKPAGDAYDNAFNTVRANVKAEQNAENTPEAKAAANMALSPLSNTAANAAH